MTITASAIFSALLWSAVAGLAAWLITYPVRRRWLIGLFASVVLTAIAASLGALLGGVSSMLLPHDQLASIIVLTVGAGAVALIAAGFAARRLTKDNRALRAAVVDLAEGRVPASDGRRLTAQLDDVRRELASTASALRATRERERALEASRRELVSWVSHDLRTPLAGMRAMTEALEDGMVEDPAPYYKQIGASVDRLSEMVDDLFDLSRIQAGTARRSLETVDIDDLVSDVIAALGPLAAATDVTLVGTPDGRATVRGDGPQLDRAITNLVANAIRHTPPEGTVTVFVRRVGDAVDIVVRDECGGIDLADLPRVFEVGYRGEAARTASTDGSTGAGLGLAIARGIVEAHDGNVSVVNTDAGCAFTLELPST